MRAPAAAREPVAAVFETAQGRPVLLLLGDREGLRAGLSALGKLPYRPGSVFPLKKVDR